MAAELFVASISAALQAVQTWLSIRDAKSASSAGRRQYQSALREPRYLTQARALESIVPADILETMSGRVQACWKSYHKVIGSDDEYLPDEIDNATSAVKRCICRELQRIRDLNGGHIPEGDLQDWWRPYCEPAT